MQTSFSQHPYPSELFTPERRRTRMRRFLEALERPALTGLPQVPDLFPIKVADGQIKSHVWTGQAHR